MSLCTVFSNLISYPFLNFLVFKSKNEFHSIAVGSIQNKLKGNVLVWVFNNSKIKKRGNVNPSATHFYVTH